MDATTMPKIVSLSLKHLKEEYADITFRESDTFYWSPKESSIYYHPKALEEKQGFYQLLHEVGHALCNHKSYDSGVELLKMEVAAWATAQEIAEKYETTIPTTHIEKCLDSYRDWLHLRSACPDCKNISVEVSVNQYRCFNCLQTWNVPQSQQTRRYRLKLAASS